jgi:hypothetical protein
VGGDGRSENPMAIFFDMRHSNPAGTAALAGSAPPFAHFNISNKSLPALTAKTPDILMSDFFSRSTTLIGPIWCVQCGPLSQPTPAGRNWQMICRLGTQNDVTLLKGGPSFQWLDALTLINHLNIGTANLYFDMDVNALTPGVTATYREQSSLLV